MIVGVDTETTGLDTFHGCRPYLITTCDGTGCQRTFQWEILPKSRKVLVNEQDVRDIQELLDSADRLVFHNSKFDIKMIASIGIKVNHLWAKIEDTLFIAHMLASQTEHNLTAVVKTYLKRDITPYEEAMQKAVQSARRWCRSHLKDWKLATDGLQDEEGSQLMPSTKGSNETGRAWMADTWLPKAVALHEGRGWVEAHERKDWLTVTDDYADIDSSCLIPLFQEMWKEVERRKLEKIYRERLRILPVVHRMEHYGTTYKLDTHEEMKREFTEKVEELEATLHGIADCYDYQLVLPKRGRNKSLDGFVFDVLKVPVLELSDKGNPVFDSEKKEEYELTLSPNSMAQRFIRALNEKGEYDTALGYMAAYERFCIKDRENDSVRSNNSSNTTDSLSCVGNLRSSIPTGVQAWGDDRKDRSGNGRFATLYPNLNPTGTVGLRFSHTNPNSANVSKHKATNLRKCFGPREGRVWYSCDYTGIELAIPAYEAGETEMIKVFECPDDPPYYGSYHLLIFDTLHPEKFKEHGKKVKQLYEDTWYQWVKNGNFARQYGAQEKKVDQTYQVPGGYQKVAKRFPKIDALSQKMLHIAERNNCVTTVPDRFIDPTQGFPIQSKRTHYGKVKPTTPFCYHVSSTAGQVLNRAMVMCDERLSRWRAEGFDAHMILTIHDELVFDMPLITPSNYERTDLRANDLRGTMESAANGIGIPIRVSVERHILDWASGEVIPKS